ncbi:MAG: carboxypeptidase-like regulatory domain-containing protein [Odoribacteraceae bacterium]|jgi:ABC-type Fe3+-hydroxamate transport system substrate-binding protein|nr:carboxypeptidase-like regulatory domain-containing protein [Odoribacteraceae bacterium]
MKKLLFIAAIAGSLLGSCAKFTVEEKTDTLVTGVISDSLGRPLPGVSVLLKETRTSTVTDTNGRFTIKMPKNRSALRFRYIGMSDKEVVIDDNTDVYVVMKDDPELYREIITTTGIVYEKNRFRAFFRDLREEVRKTISSLNARVAGIRQRIENARK